MESRGKSINIWLDYWIPGHSKLHQKAPNSRVQEHGETVASLIDPYTSWWDVERINSTLPPFCCRSAQIIFTICTKRS